jgi:hypothetical protein
MAAMEWGEGTPWRPSYLREDARGGGVARSMEGRRGGLLEPPWSGGERALLETQPMPTGKYNSRRVVGETVKGRQLTCYRRL